jgi:hypothetical protein
MAERKMVMRGNATRPEVIGRAELKPIAWPKGALHVKATTDYAEREAMSVVLDVPEASRKPAEPASQGGPEGVS